jgi:hypothetical protein
MPLDGQSGFNGDMPAIVSAIFAQSLNLMANTLLVVVPQRQNPAYPAIRGRRLLMLDIRLWRI